ncbi:hypothetical protein VW35_19545 [Devosia soli]|uniref:Transglutaminase-like domain-containing protein n=1 Tax=Devosia soli TaxID=361041 RepID=A0A0F5L151_9HYPH|nr:transglutaminase domain-containing protein [Devosia soli]KKB75939.1 hypothetical protein VW35_19545 [Devosia soli]
MRIGIEHKLRVTLPPGTGQAVLHLLLTPPSGQSQTVESWSVEAPGIGNAGRLIDGFGNTAHLVNQTKPEGEELLIRVRGTVTTRDTHGVLGRPPGEPMPALYRRLTEATRSEPDFVEAYRGRSVSRLDLLHGLMADVRSNLAHNEPVPTQMQADGGQVQRQGGAEAAEPPSAAEHVHLFIAAARALNIPARFVAGYRLGEDADGGCLHAWAEALDDGLGWIGFDPQAVMCPTDAYVRLATGLDAQTATVLRIVPQSAVTEEVTLTRHD